eukprot:480490-Pleurochrysis_carterae.AAC.1
MAAASWPQSTSAAPASADYPLALAPRQGRQHAGSSSGKRRSPPMMDLAFVKNVRPTRLERRTKTGAHITKYSMLQAH